MTDNTIYRNTDHNVLIHYTSCSSGVTLYCMWTYWKWGFNKKNEFNKILQFFSKFSLVARLSTVGLFTVKLINLACYLS